MGSSMKTTFFNFPTGLLNKLRVPSLDQVKRKSLWKTELGTLGLRMAFCQIFFLLKQMNPSPSCELDWGPSKF